jgi:ubiquinone biosynthesis monooxygenase Coq7
MEVIARLAADESLGDRVMKVDHAGEHGAVNVYRAQLLACRWRRSDITSELREFLDHEMRHRAVFAAELMRRGRPRCRSYHLCGLGGFALGLITGLCGRASIAATTCRGRDCCLTTSRGSDIDIAFGRPSGRLGR